MKDCLETYMRVEGPPSSDSFMWLGTWCSFLSCDQPGFPVIILYFLVAWWLCSRKKQTQAVQDTSISSFLMFYWLCSHKTHPKGGYIDCTSWWVSKKKMYTFTYIFYLISYNYHLSPFLLPDPRFQTHNNPGLQPQ